MFKSKYNKKTMRFASLKKTKAHAKSQPRNSRRTTPRRTDKHQQRDTKRDALLEKHQNTTRWRTTCLKNIENQTSLAH